MNDLKEAALLYPEDKDVEKMRKLTEEDMELEERVKVILANSDALLGKEYLDFFLNFH
jgi:hypothetical protein